MPNDKHTFPWGIYIGDLIDNNNNTIPLCLDSKQGGFCLLFDDESENIANNFIENVALKLIKVMPLGSIKVDIFDFGRPRFMKLSALRKEKLYNISYNKNMMSSKFETFDEIMNRRLYHLLSANFPTLNEHNRVNENKEKYHLLLIHLDDLLTLDSSIEIKKLFDSAYDIGFYVIVFGRKNSQKNKSKTAQEILNKLSPICINNKMFKVTELCAFSKLFIKNQFKYIGDTKSRSIEPLSEQNFFNGFVKSKTDIFDTTSELIDRALRNSQNREIQINIHQGDIVQHKTTVYAERIENCFSQIQNSTVNNDLKTLLELMNKEALKVSNQIEPKKQEEFITDVEVLTTEALKEKPNKKLFDISVQGVLEALETVGNIGNTFIQLIPKIMEFL